MGIEIQESYLDATRGIRTGETGWYAPYTNDRGALYRSLVKEYGRCTGRVYIDRKVRVSNDPTDPAFRLEPKPIGWVFVKRRRYEDTGKPYLAETWVSVRDAADES